ncbi:MAG: hypothetical protein P8J45_13615 [Phycisphaerales bacterium]|nr:hypothetical protein [Phycisphaerales bacterium]
MSPCSGVTIDYFEQTAYAKHGDLVSDLSNDEFVFDDPETGEEEANSANAEHGPFRDGYETSYARGTQYSVFTSDNQFRFVNNNYSYSRFKSNLELTTVSSMLFVFTVEDNLESESGFSLTPSRHHSVWLDMHASMTSAGSYEEAGGFDPGSSVTLIGPAGTIYSNSSRLSDDPDDRNVVGGLEIELEPGSYMLMIDVLTHIKSSSHTGSNSSGRATVGFRFHETASEGDVAATILSQYREVSTSNDSISDTGPCKSSLAETSGSDAWSYQDSDIRSLNTYGAFYNFARSSARNQLRKSSGHLSVEFRLEEDALMDVVLRGTYEINKTFGDVAQASYQVRVENIDTGVVAYLKSETWSVDGAGSINVMDDAMLPAGDYLLLIETDSKCRKGGFLFRARRDASVHLSPSISFSN